MILIIMGRRIGIPSYITYIHICFKTKFLSLIVASLTFIGTILVLMLTITAMTDFKRNQKSWIKTRYLKISYTCTKEAIEHT